MKLNLSKRSEEHFIKILNEYFKKPDEISKEKIRDFILVLMTYKDKKYGQDLINTVIELAKETYPNLSEDFDKFLLLM